jgi:RNA polymerase-binding transcription factor DksA
VTLARTLQYARDMMPAVSPRDRLLARRNDLLHRVREATLLADEVSADVESEVIDKANGQWDARVLSRYGDAETRQLSAVEAALKRLADGTYGTCTRCETKINRARLEAMPEAAMCASCASWTEKKHAE